MRITEKMAELMTPPKDGYDKTERTNILMRLASCCKDQSSYHLACKKYTQAGDKNRAMMCLIKSADTEKIIYYAAMTKKREIYIQTSHVGLVTLMVVLVANQLSEVRRMQLGTAETADAE